MASFLPLTKEIVHKDTVVLFSVHYENKFWVASAFLEI